MPMSRSVLLILVAACGDDDVPRSDAGAPALDCPGVFDCVAVCPETDAACPDACVARASATAIPLVTALVGCADRNGCTTEDCLATNCTPEVLACAGSPTTDGGVTDAGGCESAGRPEMTGPITGLQPSYVAGDPIDVGVPVDEDTARVIIGVYEVGSELYLGGTAEDTTGSTTRTLSFFAGVAGGKTGTFYLAIELCSTSVCTSPFVRNTYQRADRTAPMLAPSETYAHTREFVGGPAMTETCPSTIPIQSFTIE